eukprot:PhM_4_TR18662/c0_g1_i2/m.19907
MFSQIVTLIEKADETGQLDTEEAAALLHRAGEEVEDGDGIIDDDDESDDTEQSRQQKQKRRLSRLRTVLKQKQQQDEEEKVNKKLMITNDDYYTTADEDVVAVVGATTASSSCAVDMDGNHPAASSTAATSGDNHSEHEGPCAMRASADVTVPLPSALTDKPLPSSFSVVEPLSVPPRVFNVVVNTQTMELTAEVERLRRAMYQLRDEYGDMAVMLRQYERKFDTHREVLNLQNQQLHDKGVELASVLRQLEHMCGSTKAKEEYAGQRDAVLTELAQIPTQHLETVVHSLTATVDNLEKTNARLRKNEARLESECSAVQTNATIEINGLRSAVDALEQRLQDATHSSTDHDRMMERLTSVQDELRFRSSCLDLTVRERDTLQRERDQLEGRVKELELHASEIKDISSSVFFQNLSTRRWGGRGIAAVARRLDAVSLRTAYMLRANVVLRLMIVLYVLILHLWVFYLVTSYVHMLPHMAENVHEHKMHF